MPIRRLVLALTIPMALGLMTSHSVAEDEVRKIDNFRLLLHNGDNIQGQDGQLSATNLTGTNKAGEIVDVPLADIHSLDVSTGSNAGKGALIGAGLGATIAILAILQVSADEQSELNEDRVAPVTLGLTAAGGLLGAAIGSGSKKWERVSLPDQVSFVVGANEFAGCVRISF